MSEQEWQPIETAPRNNKRPLLLAEFYDGKLAGLDWDGRWESDTEEVLSIPQVYWYWASALNSVEEPTHWMFQPEWFASCAI